MNTRLLSIIIPVYNEINTIEKVLNKIDSLVLNDYHKQVIVVDDFSNDGTRKYLRELKSKRPDYTILFHKKNCGKGQAISTVLQYVDGENVALVDADEEVDISVIVEWLSSIRPEVAAVIGIRKYECVDNYLYYLGRLLLSAIFRILFHNNIQDPLVGLKLIRNPVIKSMELRSNGFEINQYNFVYINAWEESKYAGRFWHVPDDEYILSFLALPNYKVIHKKHYKNYLSQKRIPILLNRRL